MKKSTAAKFGININNQKTLFERLKPKHSIGHNVVFGVFEIFFLLYSISMIFPLLWAFIVSLKSQQEYMLNSVFALPEDWLFSNYLDAFKSLNIKGTNMFGLILNSLWYSVGACVISIFVCAMTAYIFARYPFKGSGIAYNMILVIMLLPIVGTGAARYKLFSSLGLTNSPLYLLSCTGGIGFNFIVLHSFFKGISWHYAEAAFIDGASHSTVFFKIMLPQTSGIIIALMVISFIGLWNDYSTPMIYFPNMPTLATGLYEYEQAMIRGVNMPVYFAGLLISTLPVIIIFIFFQNTIMQSVSVGGLKG